MPDRSSRNPSHDKIFKTLFRLFLSDLVELLERGIAASFDLSSVVFPSSEAFSEMKKGGHLDPDFVARSARRDRAGFLVLHAETEARFRRATEARMWRYFSHLSAQFGDDLVLPLVAFLKGGPPNLRQIELERDVGSFARDRYEAAFAKEKASMVPFPLTFEEALEESKARGQALGEARGEIRGELRATCEAILRVVERRFGQIPGAFSAQLAAISEPGRLRSIFDSALEAQSFDQLEASLG